MDARSAPERVGSGHPDDKLADVSADRRAAGLPGTRLPSPVVPEALPMPTHDRGRLDDHERVTPASP